MVHSCDVVKFGKISSQLGKMYMIASLRWYKDSERWKNFRYTTC